MAARSLGQASLVKDNLISIAKLAKKCGQSVQGLWREGYRYFRCNCHGISAGELTKILGKTALKGFFLTIGILSSLSYSLSFAGAIYSNTKEDYLLGSHAGAQVLLAVLGSLPMLLATLKMGHELETIIKSVLSKCFSLTQRQCKRLNHSNGEQNQLKWYMPSSRPSLGYVKEGEKGEDSEKEENQTIQTEGAPLLTRRNSAREAAIERVRRVRNVRQQKTLRTI